MLLAGLFLTKISCQKLKKLFLFHKKWKIQALAFAFTFHNLLGVKWWIFDELMLSSAVEWLSFNIFIDKCTVFAEWSVWILLYAAFATVQACFRFAPIGLWASSGQQGQGEWIAPVSRSVEMYQFWGATRTSRASVWTQLEMFCFKQLLRHDFHRLWISNATVYASRIIAFMVLVLRCSSARSAFFFGKAAPLIGSTDAGSAGEVGNRCSRRGWRRATPRRAKRRRGCGL